MTMVIQDPTTVQQLRQTQKAIFLTDSAGHVLGHFVPGDPIGSEPPISEEELQRREKQKGRRLADILADLEKRA
jgi:hypothetical protein